MGKIKVEVYRITKGMYVSELDRPWAETPFLFQGFRITNERELEKLKEICDFVYIDEEKSTVDIDPKLAVLSGQEGNIKSSKVTPLYNIQIKHEPHKEKFEKEFPVAKKTYREAFIKMNKVFTDIRIGKSLDVLAVKSTVNDMAESILRNPDALKLLCVLQDYEDNAVTHALHVCVLSLAFGKYLGLDKDMIQKLGIGGLLHDIGETRLPEGLLWKSKHYTKAEKVEIQKHTQYGVDIVNGVHGFDAVVTDIVREHHERINGTGYPNNSSGNEISYNAMMVSIIDVYDSVTMGYEGKDVVSCTEALKMMYDWRNELFQGELVELFIQCLGIYPVGSVVVLNSNEVGIVVTFDECSRLAPRVMLIMDKDLKYYPSPKLIDLSSFKDKEEKYLYEIKKVVNPEDYNIDLKQHILEELYIDKVVNQ